MHLIVRRVSAADAGRGRSGAGWRRDPRNSGRRDGSRDPVVGGGVQGWMELPQRDCIRDPGGRQRRPRLDGAAIKLKLIIQLPDAEVPNPPFCLRHRGGYWNFTIYH